MIVVTDATSCKAAAAGREVEVLSQVAGIPDNTLDGQHHSCSKCGGKDRFRLIDKDAGAVHCNQCFSKGNGDFLAAIQHYRGVGFQEAIRMTCQHLGVEYSRNGHKTSSDVTYEEADIRDRFYRQILAAIPLKERHREDLKRRGLVNIDDGLFATFTNEKVLKTVGEVANRLNLTEAQVLSIPGIAIENNKLTRQKTEGMAIPVIDCNGKIIAISVRMNSRSKGSKDRYGSKYRYWSYSKNKREKHDTGPSTGTPLGFFGNRDSEKVWITEGHLKGYIASQLTGERFIAMGGVHSVASAVEAAISEAATKEETLIVVAMDADATSNVNVADASRMAVQLLREKKQEFRVAVWDPLAGKGIDDVLTEGHVPDLLKENEIDSWLESLVGAKFRAYIDCDELPLVEASLKGLRSLGCYRHGNSIVDVSEDGMLNPLNANRCRTLLSHSVSYWVDREDGDQQRPVPRQLPGQVLDHVESEVLPEIKFVSPVPFIDSNGKIFDRNGEYCKEHKTIVSSSIELCEIQRTAESAKQSAQTLVDLFQDFPFATDSDLSAAIAALITPFVRPCIDIAPFCVYEASSPASGKTLLMSIRVLLATGRMPSLTSWPNHEEEKRKKLTSMVRNAPPFISFDNVHSKIAGDTIELLATSPFYEDRLLGSNEQTGKMPLTSLVQFSVNNAAVSQDMSTRTLRIRLEPDVANPERRNDFKVPDILSHVSNRRNELATHCMNILASFIEAGAPRPAKAARNRFPQWSRSVRDALMWASGLRDPWESSVKLAESVEAEDLFGELVEALKALEGFQGDGVTAREIDFAINQYATGDYLGTRYVHPDLRKIVRSLIPDKNITLQRIGTTMKKFDGRIFEGEKFICEKHSHKNINVCRLKSARA